MSSPMTAATTSWDEGERIAKALARAGVCSRRAAERLIAEGRVSVDGEVLTSPAFKVGPGAKIRVDEELVRAAAPTKLYRFHKPEGLVTTHEDPEGRPTVFGALPPALGRLISVGRLDIATEGLLLLTNNGALARQLELPSTGWARRYKVRAYGRIAQSELDGLAEGVEIDGVRYGSAKAVLERQQGGNAWIILTISEGKNREVRRLLEHLGLRVNRLIRLSYGPFQLGSIKRGAVDEVPAKTLREQLGPKLSERLGLLEEASAHRRRK
ncbi:MAG: pseudouridine synthase [Pseudomonadota bacterium]